MATTNLEVKLPKNDPLTNPELKSVIDQVIDENLSRPGATMVVLNELQAKIGFISEPMQEYVAEKLQVPVSKVHGVVSFLFFFHYNSPRQTYSEILHGYSLLRGWYSTAIGKGKTGTRSGTWSDNTGWDDHS